ncbi:hypothetical protein J6590_022704 [Homalodisca vitripennis]|nr:hypothetical protein J6590_022704 [Homalodisca vitripennis]
MKSPRSTIAGSSVHHDPLQTNKDGTKAPEGWSPGGDPRPGQPTRSCDRLPLGTIIESRECGSAHNLTLSKALIMFSL